MKQLTFLKHPLLYGVLAASLPITSVISMHSLTIPLVILAILSSLSFTKSDFISFFKNPIARAFLLFLSYGLLSACWAVNPMLSLKLSGKLLLFSLAAALWWTDYKRLNETTKNYMHTGLFLGIVLTLVFCLVEWYLGYPFSNFMNRSATRAIGSGAMFLSIGVWVFYKRSLLFYLGVLVVSYVISKMGTDTALVGLWASVFLSIFYPFIQRLRYTNSTLLGVFLGVVFLTPWVCLTFTDQTADWVAKTSKDTSYVHRIYLAQHTAYEITQRPFLGRGLDNSRTFPKIIETHEFCPKENECQTMYSEYMGMHPHNAPLQWWLELGLIGVLIVSAIFFYVFKEFSTYGLSIQARCVYFSLAALSIPWFSSGVWQSWWISSWILLFPLLRHQKEG